MAVIKPILHHWARFRPAGFAQLTLFLGIILLATPLRQERRILWVLLQLMFLDALLVSLSANETEVIPLVTRTPMALGMDCQDLTSRVPSFVESLHKSLHGKG
jgi:hypothetical protein